jgi:hypothetical protein
MSNATTARHHRSRRTAHASLDWIVLGILVAVTVLVLGLLAFGNWMRSGPLAPRGAADPTGLLPLAQPVNPIAGFHDMEHMPNPNMPGQAVAASVPQANIDLPVLRWDWGAIPRMPHVQYTFPIQNTGNQPLLITSVVTSCGCTTADLSSSVIPAGQRADLVVTFDPNFHETSGPVTRLVWLETNDPDLPVVELRLDANVLP